MNDDMDTLPDKRGRPKMMIRGKESGALSRRWMGDEETLRDTRDPADVALHIRRKPTHSLSCCCPRSRQLVVGAPPVRVRKARLLLGLGRAGVDAQAREARRSTSASLTRACAVQGRRGHVNPGAPALRGEMPDLQRKMDLSDFDEWFGFEERGDFSVKWTVFSLRKPKGDVLGIVSIVEPEIKIEKKPRRASRDKRRAADASVSPGARCHGGIKDFVVLRPS
ncbi:hypothetical protein B0H19DRAFT_1058187 [Mycena capillaripes]|nr:hypothetical protein B0H19DRAFT_1058187 [Mycena capillaripes]